MKKLILIVAIIFSGMLMQAQFRNTTWGMTKAEVKQTESLELKESHDDMLAYETSFLGLDTYIVYEFNNDELISSGYIFINENTHNNEYIDDYFGINELLIEKYEEPIIDEVKWNSNTWKFDKNEWGYALLMGHVEYESVFYLDKMVIRHILSGGNYDIFHAIKYSDPENMERTMKEDLDKL